MKISEYHALPCLCIKVIPSASKNAFRSITDQEIRIAIAAPPEKGKANDELVAFLAKTLGFSKKDIQIAQGQTSRIKLVTFSNCSAAELQARLDKAMG